MEFITQIHCIIKSWICFIVTIFLSCLQVVGQPWEASNGTPENMLCVGKIDFDFNNWEQKGDTTYGTWTVLQGGTDVLQSLNDDPSFFVSPYDLINVQIDGKVTVASGGGNDFIGFVLGFQDPLNTIYDVYDMWLFDWKKSQQTNNGYFADEGHTLSKINGQIPPTNIDQYFWGHPTDSIWTLVNTDYGNTLGWNYNQTYDVRLIYTFTQLTVIIDNDTIFHQIGCFEPGRFGFYTFSQQNATFSNFSYELKANFETTDICLNDVAYFNFIDTCITSYNFPAIDSLIWDFGDGTIVSNTNPTLNNANPSHLYSSAGVYNVTLTVTDTAGCQDVVIKPITVTTSAILNVTALGTTNVCIGDTAFLYASTIPNVTYSWTGPNGFTSNLQNPSFIGFSSADTGTYYVSVILSACTSGIDSISIQSSCISCNPSINFNTWHQAGDPSYGTWSVSPSGNSLHQAINGNPSFFVSPNDMINFEAEGYVSVASGWDNDFIGFVFGFQNPLGTNYDNYDMWLFDWKQEQQSKNGGLYTADEGFALSRVNGTIPIVDKHKYFWDHPMDSLWQAVATNYGNQKGWVYDQTYHVRLLYTLSELTIIIDNDTIFQEKGCFQPGRFGMYTYTQEGVTYSNFSYTLKTNFTTSNICLGELAQFTFLDTCNTNFDYSTLDSLIWNFGDGTSLVSTNLSANNINTSHLYSNAGSYVVTLITVAPNGCRDTISQTIDVLSIPILNLTDTTLCHGEPLTISIPTNDSSFWYLNQALLAVDTINWTWTPTHNDTLIIQAFSNACPIYDTMVVTVLDTFYTTESRSICQGDSTIINSNVVTNAGTYCYTLTATNGCDSTHCVIVVVLDTFYITESRSICQGDSTIINSNVVTNAGTYCYTLTATNGCDSIHCVTVTVLDTFYTTENRSICQGDITIVNGNMVTNAETYCYTLTATNGCDSTHCVTITVLDTFYTTENRSICQGDSTFINGNTVTNAGTYCYTLIAANGCDSTHCVTVAVLDTFYTTENRSICQGDSTFINGNAVTNAGTYCYTLIAANGCDSTHCVTVAVLDTFYTTESRSICQGDSTFINGNAVTNAGTYCDTLTAANGCDSIHCITLMVLDTFLITEIRDICQGDFTVINGNPVTAVGIYFYTVPVINGCDTLYQITVNILDTFYTIENRSICQGDSTIVNGNVVTSAGTYCYTLAASNGCDSTHCVTVTVLDTFYTTENRSICQGDSTIVNGNAVTIAGTYCYTLTAINGCDSTYCVTVTVLDTFYTTESRSICQGDSTIVNGNAITIEGTYCYTLTAINGCDSTHCVTVTVLDTFYTTENRNICQGNAIMINGNIVSIAGTYCHTFTASNGCDSTHCATIIVHPIEFTELQLNTCDPTQAGIFEDTLASIYGCDSIVTTIISLQPTDTTYYQESTCDIDSVGTYIEVLSNQFGCDSIILTTFYFEEPNTTTEAYSICEGDSLYFEGQYFTTSGIYCITDPLDNCEINCLDLTVHPLPDIELLDTVVVPIGQSYALNPNDNSSYFYQWYPVQYLDCDDCPNPITTPEDDISYSVDVETLEGCETSDSIHITIYHLCNTNQIKVPNAIFPNTANNRFWMYEERGLERLIYLQVYNRWGNLVFSTDDPNEPWYGKYNEEDAEGNVYYYSIKGICKGGKEFMLTGNITVLR